MDNEEQTNSWKCSFMGDPAASGEATKLKLAERPCQRCPPQIMRKVHKGCILKLSASLEVKEPSLQKREGERSSREPQQVQWRQRSNLDNYDLDGRESTPTSFTKNVVIRATKIPTQKLLPKGLKDCLLIMML